MSPSSRLDSIRIELCVGHNVKKNRYCQNDDPMHWNRELCALVRHLEARPSVEVLLEGLEQQVNAQKEICSAADSQGYVNALNWFLALIERIKTEMPA